MSETDKLKSLLKNGKLTYMLIAACAALVLLMLLWPTDTKNTENEAPETVELTAEDYTKALSAQIAQMVSAITGESEPQVTVTLRTMGETVYATEDKQSEKSAEEYSGESLNRMQTDGDTQKTYILVKAADGSQKPLIVTKTEPEIRGVVVVSRGGSNPKMREKIVEAVKTALDLSSTQVCVVGYSEYTYGNE